MGWRDSLGKPKFKYKYIKDSRKCGKFLKRIVGLLVVLGIAFFVLHQSGASQSIYEKINSWINPSQSTSQTTAGTTTENIIETKIIETTVVKPIIVEKTSTESVVIMPEGNWYKYDTNNSHYKPVTEMSALIEQLNVTSLGQAIIDKTKPRFETEAKIMAQNENLSGDGVIILGLWKHQEYKDTRTEEIIMLAPDDELYDRCGSDPKITLMHEMLHSIDHNDDTFAASDFGRELAAMYPSIYNEIKTLGYSEDHINDELFARVGSEKINAPAEVKAIYAKYFEGWGS